MLIQRTLRAAAERARWCRSLASAVRVQAAARCWLARRRLPGLKAERTRLAEQLQGSASKLQSSWRRHRLQKMARQRQGGAALLIQQHCRVQLARAAVGNAAAQRELSRQVAAVELQRAGRVLVARKALIASAALEAKWRGEAAVELQRSCRTFLARAVLRAEGKAVLERLSKKPEAVQGGDCPPWRCRGCNFLNEVHPEHCVLCDRHRGAPADRGPHRLRGLQCAGEMRTGGLSGRPPSARASARRRVRAE